MINTNKRILIEGRDPKKREQIDSIIRKIHPKTEITHTDSTQGMINLITNMQPYNLVFMDAFNTSTESMYPFENISAAQILYNKNKEILSQNKIVGVTNTNYDLMDILMLHKSIKAGLYDYISSTNGNLDEQIIEVLKRENTPPPKITNPNQAKIHFIFGHTEAAKSAISIHTNLYLPNTVMLDKHIVQPEATNKISQDSENFPEFKGNELNSFDSNYITWERNHMTIGLSKKQINEYLQNGIDIILSTDSPEGAMAIQKELSHLPIITYILHMKDKKNWEKMYEEKKKHDTAKFADLNEPYKLREALIEEHAEYEKHQLGGSFNFTSRSKDTDKEKTLYRINYTHSLENTDFYSAAKQFIQIMSTYREK